jgi:hypothetical protein
MTTLEEKKHPGEFLKSTPNGTRHVEEGVLASGNNLEAGTVLGVVTASGEYSQFDDTAADGTENAVAILFAGVDASAADADCVVVARDAEVTGSELTWPATADDAEIAAATAQLAAAGIIIR